MRESKPKFNTLQLGDVAIAIISAKWNSDYNNEMLESAEAALVESGIAEDKLDIFEVPGAFEIPYLAKKLAETSDYDAILCYATIIKGDTYHFDIVANESARGIMDVMLQTDVPVFNGILAVNTPAQAQVRASRSAEDKGREVALSALALLAEISEL